MPDKDPAPDFKPDEPRCGQADALWLVVLILLLGVGTSLAVATGLGALGYPPELSHAVLFVGLYCALGLVALLATAIALTVGGCCLPEVAASCSPEPGAKETWSEGTSC